MGYGRSTETQQLRCPGSAADTPGKETRFLRHEGGRTTRPPRTPPPERRRAGGLSSAPSQPAGGQAGDEGPAEHTPLQPTEQGGGRAPGTEGASPLLRALPSPARRAAGTTRPAAGAHCRPHAHTLTTEVPSLSTSTTGGSPPRPTVPTVASSPEVRPPRLPRRPDSQTQAGRVCSCRCEAT